MVENQEIHDILENVFDNVKGLHMSDQVQINCPKCQEREGLSYGDGKYNLEINTRIKRFRCWKCDDPPFQGRLGRLIKRYGLSTDYALYKVYAGNEDDDFGVSVDDEEEVTPIVLPEEFISISDVNLNIREHYEAYEYLVTERKLDIELLKRFNVGFCTKGKYYGRIIVPSYDRNGVLNYFISRLYTKESWRTKYENPEENKKKIIYNESRIKWDSTIFLVEGAFDMLSIPINTIPVLGKNMSDALLDKLRIFKPNIIIVLDPDAVKNAREIMIQLVSIYGNEKCCKIKIVELPNNDDIDELRKKYDDAMDFCDKKNISYDNIVKTKEY